MKLEEFAGGINSILTGFPQIRLVYLFGSRVSGQAGPQSDYDLGILVDTGQDEFSIQAAFQHAVSRLTGTGRVDVVLLRHAPVELAFQIIASGKLLYQTDTYTRVEFEAGVMGRYGDYLPVLRAFAEQIRQGDPHGKRVQRYRETLRRTERTLGAARTAARSKPG